MRKHLVTVLVLISCSVYGQDFSPREKSDTLDVLSFTVPEFFQLSKADSMAVLQLVNNDTSVCRMVVYRGYRDSSSNDETLKNAWKRFVFGSLDAADSIPRMIMPDTVRNGWKLSVAISNYRQHGKRAVVYMYLFSNKERKAVAVVSFSDRIFRQPVEKFDKALIPL